MPLERGESVETREWDAEQEGAHLESRSGTVVTSTTIVSEEPTIAIRIPKVNINVVGPLNQDIRPGEQITGHLREFYKRWQIVADPLASVTWLGKHVIM